ncbi:MAG: DUF2851 family protein [Chitinophagaceae bacterium]|nr:MAG: DUF2851 family protein [Chitinophagaceae bacterium]
MTEKLLQFIWQFGYYNNGNLATTDGESLTVVFPGSLNKNQGPDFINARIKIGSTTLAGAIELHTKTSEWKKHKHDADENYRNVMLHVVYEHDEKVNDVPVLELSPRISKLLLERYAYLMENAAFIPCSTSIHQINQLVLSSWKERLLIERLKRKSATILQLLEQSNHHWEETFWWLLGRNFGSKINNETFEAIARSIPVTILAKHKSSIHQIEALLFGQANLLNEDFDDEYPKLLQREYRFLQKKYGLQPVQMPVLFLRMRPGNFPTVRLAQLAMLVSQTSHLFSKILELENLVDLKNLFAVTANDFWHYHYTFRQASTFKKKTLGADTINNLIINTLIPVLFSYAIYHKEDRYKEKALRWLEEVPAENNSITTGFVKAGIQNNSAYDSQSLIELKNEYCNQKKCLECTVGNNLLKEAAHGYKVLNPV